MEVSIASKYNEAIQKSATDTTSPHPNPPSKLPNNTPITSLNLPYNYTSSSLFLAAYALNYTKLVINSSQSPPILRS